MHVALGHAPVWADEVGKDSVGDEAARKMFADRNVTHTQTR
ncbi:hypothetical protein LMG27177_01436 [Paraburkholderia fynbosensis]|uniref:Uncharacterized protein n=1 Tax=Paraburkholderia fynbosensis TaxID=1200993 RepID=A0A6J5FMU1_9BURK|nr:hypothetical protein LMG27177_01436 [Paraburkholderia fynbosensis]